MLALIFIILGHIFKWTLIISLLAASGMLFHRGVIKSTGAITPKNSGRKVNSNLFKIKADSYQQEVYERHNPDAKKQRLATERLGASFREIQRQQEELLRIRQQRLSLEDKVESLTDAIWENAEADAYAIKQAEKYLNQLWENEDE